MNALKSNAAPKRQSRQRRSYGKTREKLLVAAQTVFAEKGLASTTIDDITERADVGRGSFYYHFKDKNRLIGQLTESILSNLVTQIEEECKGKEDLESVLHGMIGAHINFFTGRWKDFVLYFQGRADLTLSESYEGLETPFLKYIKIIEELIDNTIPEPISDARLRRLACAIAGFISGYYSFASVASEESDIDESFAALQSAFVSSLVRFIREALPEPVVGSR